jgi:hypothetical protein
VNVTSTFDYFLKTKIAFGPGIILILLSSEIETGSIKSRKPGTIDINNLHKILGYCSKISARLIEKSSGFEFKGSFITCETGSTTLEEQLDIDISTIKGNSFRGEKFWALIVQEYMS